MLHFTEEEIELLPSNSQKKSNQSEWGTIEAFLCSNILLSRLPYAIENAAIGDLCDKLSFPELRHVLLQLPFTLYLLKMETMDSRTPEYQ